MISADSLLYALISLRREGAPTPWETCNAVLQAAEPCDIVAVGPPGAHVVRSLQARLPKHTVFHHLPAELIEADEAGASVESGIPIILWDRDRDRRPVHVSCWPPVPSQPRVRLRQLDTLYADSHLVKLLVLDCPSSAASVLRGGRRVLADHRPVILLELTAVPLAARTAVWEACVRECGGGYAWYDGLMLPCATPERRGESVLACANRIACGLPVELARPNPLPAGVAEMLPADALGWAGLAWADWRDAVSADPARHNGVTIQFDDGLSAKNFHPAETDGNGAWWRWSGPGVRSSFAMPIPAHGRWNLRLAVINMGVVKQPSDLRLYAAGQRLQPGRFDGHTITFGPVNFSAADPANVAKVQIITPPPRRASDDDPRRIGISLMQCALEPA